MFRLSVVVLMLMSWTLSAFSEDLRVMSFNLRYGTARDGENRWDNRKDFVAETIAAYDPDLLGTQETLAFQKEFLTEKLSGYTSLGVGRDTGGQTGEMTALFFKTDRFEKVDEGHFWLSTTPDVPGSVSWDSSLTRMASWVRLKDRRGETERPLVFVNTHFDHVGKVARKESAALIRKQIATIADNCDVVLTGDFNAAVGSAPYQTLFDPSMERIAGWDSPRRPLFVDTYKQRQPTDAPENATGEATFSGFRANVLDGARIDWIAVSGHWKVLAADIDRTSRDGRSPSDHYPVTATLRRTTSQPKPVRVLSYNIKRGLGNDNQTDLMRAAMRIDASNPDVLGLQEIDELTRRSDRVDQASTLGKRLGMQHAFGPFMKFDEGRYGLALLSKLPVTNVDLVPLPKGNEPRVAVASTVELPSGQMIAVVNVHFDWVDDDGFRYAQASALRAYLDELTMPYLLMGDFNDQPGSRTLRLLSEGALEAKKPAEDRFTYSSTDPKIEIDFILGFPADRWRFENVRVIEDPITSDHRPVFAEAYLLPSKP